MTSFLDFIARLFFVFLAAVAVILFRYLPPASTIYWALPALLLVGGGWLLKRKCGWAVTVISILVTLGGAFLVVDQFWPGTIPGQGNMTPLVAKDSSARVELPADVEKLISMPVQIPERFRVAPFNQPRHLDLPPGFRISVFAAGLGSVRFQAIGPDGHLYASVPGEGKVLVLPDADRDGVADRIGVFADRLDRPHGLAFAGRDLYVAETGKLVRLRDDDGDLTADTVEVASRDIPAGGMHWTRTLARGPDGRLYVSVGSSCNACVEDDRRRAAVLVFDRPDGPATLFASGLRNSVGLAFHPGTGELWGSDNGRDMLGDNLPPEEINRIVKGGDYGWPFCFGQSVPDPELGSLERCAHSRPAAVEMQAHSAPLGIAFGFGLKFPEYYRNLLYVAFHGSWNRTVPTGYKLVGVPFQDGKPAGPPVDIVSGWLQGMTAWGRPVDPVVGSDGALFLSDDRAGAIYRLAAE